MPNMKKFLKCKVVKSSSWITDQDIYLIENSWQGIDELLKNFPYTEDQILNRKKVLGLIKREWQIRKFI
ncbi:hypothetical protein D3C78_60950 [compost metagenome]